MTTSINPVTATPATPTGRHHHSLRLALIVAAVGAGIALGGASVGVVLAADDPNPSTPPIATSVPADPHQEPAVLRGTASADTLERRAGDAIGLGTNGCTGGIISADAAERCAAAVVTGG